MATDTAHSCYLSPLIVHSSTQLCLVLTKFLRLLQGVFRPDAWIAKMFSLHDSPDPHQLLGPGFLQRLSAPSELGSCYITKHCVVLTNSIPLLEKDSGCGSTLASKAISYHLPKTRELCPLTCSFHKGKISDWLNLRVVFLSNTHHSIFPSTVWTISTGHVNITNIYLHFCNVCNSFSIAIIKSLTHFLINP